MLQPCYGVGMHHAAAVLLVPDIPLTDSKKSLQLTLHFTNYFMIYNFNFTFNQKCDVWDELSGFKA